MEGGRSQSMLSESYLMLLLVTLRLGLCLMQGQSLGMMCLLCEPVWINFEDF